jgi:poly-gamma-glutamate synthesis protein (capsule biosynthesis protein)
MIVHRDVAEEVVKIFGALYKAGYPIRRMRLVSDYGGSDFQSIEADNTSAFNCRRATGSKRFSRHAYGKAIDLNPLENPYISSSGRIAHRASLPYAKRTKKSALPYAKAVIVQGDEVVKLFSAYGWKWGGAWKCIKDYQHFYK